MEQEKIVVVMAVEKKCKSCVRFAAERQSSAEACKTLYVQNEALVTLDYPKRIRVTIEAI